jgi:hypothetical protein
MPESPYRAHYPYSYVPLYLTGLHRKNQNSHERERYQNGKSMMQKFCSLLRNSQRRDSSILGLQLQTLMLLPIKVLLVPQSLQKARVTRRRTGNGTNCNEWNTKTITASLLAPGHDKLSMERLHHQLFITRSHKSCHLLSITAGPAVR